MIVRNLVDFQELTSFFLLGPRLTGKSTLIRKWLVGKRHYEIDLLNSRNFIKYSSDPQSLFDEVIYQIEENKIKYVFIDEIQKVPLLLDTVQSLIDKYNIHFILSGSSARKLKRMQSNLLGGRALFYRLYPLIFSELVGNYNFEKILKYGSLAGIYNKSEKLSQLKLNAYVETYLKEEIAQEGLVRNLAPFSRFIELAGQYTTQLINYENISRESAIGTKTIAQYYQILEDTFVGYFLPCWDESIRKQLSKHPKFYFFDNGITTALCGSLTQKLSPQLRGYLFEQLLINETKALASYLFSEVKFHFWRTQAGNEVDLIISRAGKPIAAIEFKNKKNLSTKDFSGLLSFSEEYPELDKIICVADIDKPTKSQKIICLPWKHFLQKELTKILAKKD